MSEITTGCVIIRLRNNNSMESRTRAYIKIQEGCDRFCAYCLIPCQSEKSEAETRKR